MMKNADFLKIGFDKILLKIKQSLFGVPVFHTFFPAPRGIPPVTIKPDNLEIYPETRGG
jgi:hypothetical protein